MKKFLDNDSIIALIQRRKNESSNTSDLQLRREDNLERYMGEKYGDERKGQSQVVTRQCMEAVEWSLPSLLRVFASSDQIAEFIPSGPEDEAAAAQETQYINHVFSEENNGFTILYTWIKDALMNPVAYVKAYWDESVEAVTEKYEEITEAQLPQILDDPDVEPVGKEEYEIEVELAPGVPVKQTVFDIEVKRKIKTGKIVVEPVPQEELFVDSKHTKIALDDCDFVCHTTYPTRSDLIAQEKFDRKVVEKLPASTGEKSNNSEKSTRDLESGLSLTSDEANDEATDLIQVDEAYLRVDFDGDGIAELRKITISDTYVLDNEEIDYIPFCAMTAVPMPHTHIGVAWQELVKDLQKIYTTLTRQLLNNLYRTNNPRPVVGRGVNLADVLNDIPNAPIRAKDINQIRMEPTQSVVQNIVPAFGILNEMKETRTGVSRTTMGLDADTLSRVTKGAFLGSLEQANQRLELLARIMAEFSIRPLFLKIHHLLLSYQGYSKQAKLSGTWVNVDPREWKKRTNMKVIVGLGTGNKQAQAMALDKVFEIQEKFLTGGKPNMVTDMNLYNSASRLVELVGLHSPEKYFADPTRPQNAQQQPQQGQGDQLAAVQMELVKVEREKANLEHQRDVAKLQAQMKEMQQDYETKIAGMQTKFSLDSRRLDQEDRKIRDTEFKILLDSEAKQAEIEQRGVSELNKQQTVMRRGVGI